MPKITVYITNYNYSNYIKQSIESVLNQTFKDFELLIIDDGSSDDSRVKIDEFSHHPNIKIIFQDRKGLNASNNVALKEADGEFILRLDADDFLKSNALEEMVQSLEKDSSLAMIFPDYFNVNEEGVVVNRVHRHDFSKEVILLDQPAHGACTMIRKKILEEVGGYDEEFDRQDGYDIWLKIIFKYKVRNLNKPLFFYRQHDKNLTKDNLALFKTRAAIKKKYLLNNPKKELKTLSIIPFRGPELDLTSQPLMKLGEKELVYWTIDEALMANNINKIIVSSPHEITLENVKAKYNDYVDIDVRSNELARLNLSLRDSILDIIKREEDSGNSFDIVSILYIDYPFKKSWQIDESIDTLNLFKVDSVDGVIQDNRFYYRHLGKGMEPLIKGRSVCLIDDVISSGASINLGWMF